MVPTGGIVEKFLSIYRGTDQNSGNLVLFQEAMRGANSLGRIAVVSFVQRNLGENLLENTFSGEELTSANDYLYEGGVPLDSLVSANDRRFLFWREQGGIDVALMGARTEDIEEYRSGLMIRLREEGMLDPPQLKQVEFYQRVRGLLDSAFESKADVLAKQDLLLTGGSFVSDYVSGETANQRLKKLEDMPESSRLKLQNNLEFRAQMVEAIDTMTKGEERERALRLLDGKIKADSELDARLVRRTLAETIEDNPPPPWNHSSVLTSLRDMPEAEKSRLRTDPEYRERLTEDLNKYLMKVPVQADLPYLPNRTVFEQSKLADQLITDISDGNESSFKDPLVQLKLQTFIVLDGADPHSSGFHHPNNKSEAFVLGEMVSDLMSNHPDLIAEIRGDVDGKDYLTVKEALFVSISASDRYTGQARAETLFDKAIVVGEMTIAERFLYTQNPDQRYALVMGNDDSDTRKLILTGEAKNEKDVFTLDTLHAYFSEEQLSALRNGIKNGALGPADRLRLAIVDGSLSTSWIEEIIQGKDVSALKVDYARSYSSDLDADILSQVPAAARLRYREILSSRPTDNLEKVLERRVEADKRDIGFFWGNESDVYLMNSLLDNSLASLEKSTGSGDEATRMIESLDSAFDLYDRDKERSKEILKETIQVAIQAGVFASTVMSGGLTIPVGLVMAGAAFNAALSDETDPWDVSKNLLIGGVDAATMMIPASFATKFLDISKGAAGHVVKAHSGNTLLREGAETQLASKLESVVSGAMRSGEKVIPSAKFAELAKSVAAEGASEKEVAALARLIEENFQGVLNKQASNYFAAQVLMYEAPIVGAVSEGLAGTAKGVLNWDLSSPIMDNVESIAATAGQDALTGAGLTVAFASAGKTIQAVLQRTPDGELTIKSSDESAFEVFTANSSESSPVKTVSGRPVIVRPGDKLRVRDASNESILSGVEVIGASSEGLGKNENVAHRPANDNYEYPDAGSELLTANAPPSWTKASAVSNSAPPELTIVSNNSRIVASSNSDAVYDGSNKPELDRGRIEGRIESKRGDSLSGESGDEVLVWNSSGDKLAAADALTATPENSVPFKQMKEFLRANTDFTDEILEDIRKADLSPFAVAKLRQLAASSSDPEEIIDDSLDWLSRSGKNPSAALLAASESSGVALRHLLSRQSDMVSHLSKLREAAEKGIVSSEFVDKLSKDSLNGRVVLAPVSLLHTSKGGKGAFNPQLDGDVCVAASCAKYISEVATPEERLSILERAGYLNPDTSKNPVIIPFDDMGPFISAQQIQDLHKSARTGAFGKTEASQYDAAQRYVSSALSKALGREIVARPVENYDEPGFYIAMTEMNELNRNTHVEVTGHAHVVVVKEGKDPEFFDPLRTDEPSEGGSTFFLLKIEE